MELIDPSLMAMDHAVGETPSSPEVSSSQSNDLVGGNRGEQEEQKQADVWSGPIGGVQAEVLVEPRVFFFHFHQDHLI